MSEPRVAPYGSWKSPITSDLIAGATVGLGQVALDGDDVYWVEQRPTEGGRNVVVRRSPDGRTTDVTPPPYNARTRVHEYGGGAVAVADGTVYFANFTDQRLYRQPPGGSPEPLTPPAALRYADAVVDRRRRRLVCVREDHTAPGREPVNTIVGVGLADRSNDSGDVDGDPGRVLVAGSDFYSSPRLSPDGQQLAWLTWNHPNMPWDGTELWVGELAPDGSVARAALVAGGPDESICQPEWSPSGALLFVSDRTGWWNLYAWEPRPGEGIRALCPRAAEFALPAWVFGISTYACESADRLVCAYVEQGQSRLGRLDLATGRLTPIPSPYTDVRSVRVAAGRAALVAGSPSESTAVVLLDLASGRREVLRRGSQVAVDPGYLSTPQPVEFPTTGGLTAFGYFYPPRNRDFVGPPGELPPLLAKSHGGPTSATSTALRLELQFWASRGIAVLDVNYGGSTGYGRAYRQRLDGQWGVVDVDDCANGARYLADRDLVDGRRLAISGGSAGGYTTLAALTFRQVFRAGASYYGVSDLEALARETHKFESRYLDRLIGPYPARRDLYLTRSPLRQAERLACPVIFFQGLEDQVVPPNQAELMVAALRAKGIPVAYLPFAGEQHGFRRAENVKRALDAELYFYGRVFGFALAEPVEPVAIDNL